MTKKYNTPMLQVISIKNNVIATSGGVGTGATLGNAWDENDITFAPDRNVFNNYYEGF